MRGVAALVTKYELDDQKLVPVALRPSILSALGAGAVGSGLATGGVAGAGDSVLQHAHSSIGMQFFGVLVTLAIAGGSGLILDADHATRRGNR
jgi:hypothetical protein